MRERDLARQVTDFLDVLMAGGYVYYVRLVGSPSIGHEARPRKGQPDIVGWFLCGIRGNAHAGVLTVPFALELKGERGRVDPAQEEDLRLARRAGAHITAILFSLDDLLNIIRARALSLPIGERVP